MPQARKTDYSVGTSCNISGKTLSKSADWRLLSMEFTSTFVFSFTRFKKALKTDASAVFFCKFS